MKKIKKIFPSRNYLTIDCKGDIEVIFNPMGDGFEGEDSLIFRAGRWCFRINDFLAGKNLAGGHQENMDRKIYALNCVYDDEDGEPLIKTSNVDPASVTPLDGSVVQVSNLGGLAQQETLSNLAYALYNDLGSVISKLNIGNEKRDDVFDSLSEVQDDVGAIRQKITQYHFVIDRPPLNDVEIRAYMFIDVKKGSTYYDRIKVEGFLFRSDDFFEFRAINCRVQLFDNQYIAFNNCVYSIDENLHPTLIHGGAKIGDTDVSYGAASVSVRFCLA